MYKIQLEKKCIKFNIPLKLKEKMFIKIKRGIFETYKVIYQKLRTNIFNVEILKEFSLKSETRQCCSALLLFSLLLEILPRVLR